MPCHLSCLMSYVICHVISYVMSFAMSCHAICHVMEGRIQLLAALVEPLPCVTLHGYETFSIFHIQDFHF